jgi:hypothetical protein
MAALSLSPISKLEQKIIVIRIPFKQRDLKSAIPDDLIQLSWAADLGLRTQTIHFPKGDLNSSFEFFTLFAE